MSENFSFDINEKSLKAIKEAIGYDEIEARHKRFMEGTETIDDLINGIYHYKIKNENGLDLDVVELKYYNKIIDLYQKEKEKAEEYRIGWCNTGEQLEQEKEKNKELEEYNKRLIKYNEELYKPDTEEPIEKFISKDKIKEKIEEYNKMINATYGDITHQGDIRRDNCIEIRNVLQELLQEGDK